MGFRQNIRFIIFWSKRRAGWVLLCFEVRGSLAGRLAGAQLSVCCDPGRFAFKESRLHLKNFPVRKFEEETHVILFLERYLGALLKFLGPI